MDAPPLEEANGNDEFEKKFLAAGTGSFSDVDIKSLGKELIEKSFSVSLLPYMQNSAYRGAPDFTGPIPDKPEIIVNIRGWSALTTRDFDDLDRILRKQIDVFNPRLLILLVFHCVENDLESELTRSITAYIPRNNTVEFHILDAYWIARNLALNHELDAKYFRDGSLTEFLPGNEKPGEVSKATPPADEILGNSLKKTVIHNDTSLYDKDLLGFENDLRAFASTIALRETKPPLAIALLGNWGSGKSFFMHNLEKKVDYLARNQGFSEIRQGNVVQPGTTAKPYCEGVVQIKFNAWSYLDANLWAGLVANIFEKLDQYLTDETKGDEQKLEAQKILSEKLAIVSDEKQKLLNEGSRLASEKEQMDKELRVKKEEKDKLYNDFLEKQSEDLKKEALKKAGELAAPLVDELEKQGIKKEDIEKMSPSELYEEARSWITFMRNIGKFNLSQIALFSVIFVVLLYLWYFPFKDLPQSVTSGIMKFAVTFIGIAAPIYQKINSAIKKIRQLTAPLKEYKDTFNLSMKEAEDAWKSEVFALQEGISEREARISEIERSLDEAVVKIEYYDYALSHSITKRAFCSFIQEKAHDKNYSNSLGIISVIRRDFEVLSELFRDIEIPEKISEDERDVLIKKKKLSKEFRDSFDKPLERIVLYIDDLDRCPDEKVLDVLQAVHLLMAYPLFIVVVGVDKRCVFNALTYKNLIQYSSYTESRNPEDLASFGINVIHPYEYLEKIFQISFHLKEATGSEIEQMVASLLEKQVETETGIKTAKETSEGEIKKQSDYQVPGSENRQTEGKVEDYSQSGKEAEFTPISPTIDDLKITATELVCLREIAWIAGSRPRTIKRFVNIYRLIRTHEQLSYNAGSREDDFLSVMFLLAMILGPHKDSAGRLFRELESKNIRKLSTCMSKGPGELIAIRDKLSECRNIKHLLSFRNTRLNKYLPFIKRFSFDYGEDNIASWKTPKPQQAEK